jgi:hypothetical protein
MTEVHDSQGIWLPSIPSMKNWPSRQISRRVYVVAGEQGKLLLRECFAPDYKAHHSSLAGA